MSAAELPEPPDRGTPDGGHPVGGTAAADAPAGVELVEPARLRLLAIASEALGRMAAEQVPAPLRPIARFAPAKRARLGAAALAAAVDADEDFRSRVAELVDGSTPQLVEAVRNGGPTGASDPLDVAVVAYLLRPPGWAALVASATDRWVRDQAATAPAAGEDTAALRAELTELRGRLKGSEARVRDEVAGATDALTAEIADLRRQLRQRMGELRAAERERDAARAAATAAAAEAAAAVHAAATAAAEEVRALRDRVGELERAAATARRSERAGRDLDDARLWLLVDTLGQAAAGIRHELSLAPPAVRPGDVVAASSAAGPVGALRRVDDPAALDRLLALPDLHVIVDGYNVTKSGYGELSLADQRTRLITSLVGVVARYGVEVTVAFDGADRPPALMSTQPVAPRGVRVLFSAAGEIADDLIRRLVAAEPPGRPVAVVTSDQEVVRDVLAAGAWSVPSATLLARLA